MNLLGLKLPCPINIGLDITLGALMHEVLKIPIVIKPKPYPSVEVPDLQFRRLGFALQQHSLTSTIYHRIPLLPHGWIARQNHDQGAMLTDLTWSPARWQNDLYGVQWPFSSRFIVFGASGVVLEGTAAGCAVKSPDSRIPDLPMMTCGAPIMAPTAYPYTNLINTVWVGLGPMDIIMGVATIAINVAFDYLFEVLPLRKMVGKATTKLAKKGVLGKAAKRAVARSELKAAIRQGREEMFRDAPQEAAEYFRRQGEDELRERLTREAGEAALTEANERAIRQAGDDAAEEAVRKYGTRDLTQREMDRMVRDQRLGDVLGNFGPLARLDTLLKGGKLTKAGAKDFGWGVGNWLAKTGVKSGSGFALSQLTDNPTFRVKFFGTSPPPYLSGSLGVGQDGAVSGGLSVPGATYDGQTWQHAGTGFEGMVTGAVSGGQAMAGGGAAGGEAAAAGAGEGEDQGKGGREDDDVSPGADEDDEL